MLPTEMDTKKASKKAAGPCHDNDNPHFNPDGPINGNARRIPMPKRKKPKEPEKLLLNEVRVLDDHYVHIGLTEMDIKEEMDFKKANMKAVGSFEDDDSSHFNADGPIDGTALGIKVSDWNQQMLKNDKPKEPSKIMLNEVKTLAGFCPTFGVEIEFMIVFDELNDPNPQEWGPRPEPATSEPAKWDRTSTADNTWDTTQTADKTWEATPATVGSWNSISTDDESTPENPWDTTPGNTWDTKSNDTWNTPPTTCETWDPASTTSKTPWGFSTWEGENDDVYNGINSTDHTAYVRGIIYDAINKFSARADEADVLVHHPTTLHFGRIDFTKWSITNDFSVKLTKEQAKLVTNRSQIAASVELVSRVFRIDDDKWEQEIATVLAAIRSLNSDTVQVLVNDSCGLHVHVGNGNRGIMPEAQRKLSLLVTAFQRQIECLHSASRFNNKRAATDYIGDAQFGTDCVYNPGPEEILRRQCYSVRKGLKMLRSRPAHELAHMMSDGQQKHTTYNLWGRVKSAESLTDLSLALNAISTVEFRQHRATLFFDEMQAWIMFVTRLMTYVVETPLDVVDQLTDKRFGDRDVTVGQFLEELEMNDTVRRFYNWKCTMRSTIKEEDDVYEREQPQASEDPANPELMTLVNSEYVSDNSWEVVGSKVAVKMRLGMYGLYLGVLDEDVSKLADRGPKGTYKVPKWLRPVWKYRVRAEEY